MKIIFFICFLGAIQCLVESTGFKKGACKSSKDCLFRGKCKGEGENAFCDCFPGLSGDHCEIVDGCAELCGIAPGVECDYNRQHRVPICVCNEEGKRFDTQGRKCVEQKPCKGFRGCKNGGYCGKGHESDSDTTYCDCIYGTSGDFCERIEECVDKPSMCGGGSDVECRFNSLRERAFCHCKNGTQRFDLPRRQCVDRSPCRENDECLPFGACTENCQPFEPCSNNEYFEGKRSCHCIEGTSGANCEVVDDCFNKEVDCGEDGTAYCTYWYISGFRGRAICKCKDPNRKFDFDKLTCTN